MLTLLASSKFKKNHEIAYLYVSTIAQVGASCYHYFEPCYRLSGNDVTDVKLMMLISAMGSILNDADDNSVTTTSAKQLHTIDN